MDATLPFLILYACFSVLLFFFDARHGLLPDRFTCPLLWSGLLFYQVCHPDGLADALWGAIIGYGTFLPRLVFLAASFACGAVVIGLLMRGKESLKNPLPFGPFLAAAGFVVGWDSLLAGY